MQGNLNAFFIIHVCRNETQEIAENAEIRKQGGWRKKGRSQIRWEDSLKGDIRKAEEEE